MNRTLLALLLTASVAALAQAPAAKPAPAPAAKPAAPAAKPAPAAAPAAAGAIVANKDSKVFHKAGCKSVGKMKETNKVPFASAAEAQKAGYKPCKECKPLG
jgi:cytochrome c5